MAQQQECAEPARLLQQALDVGDGIVRGADDDVAGLGVCFDELPRRAGLAVDVVGQRHEPCATPEVVGEVSQAVGAVLDGLVSGLGEVHGSQDSPAPTIGLGTAGSTRLFLNHTPGLADGGEALEQGHRQRQQ
jgi:hypothetical protein